MEKRAIAAMKANTAYAITGTCTTATLTHIRPGHVAGARDARKVTIIGLYRAGQIIPSLAIKYGAKMADHVEAVRNGIAIEDLAKAGVDLRRMESSRVQQMGRDVAKAARIEAQIIAAKPKAMMILRKGNGQAQVVKSGNAPSHTPTAQEIQVANAVAMAKRAAKAKADREYAAKHGVIVTLSADDRAAMIARMQAKVYVEDK